MKKDIYDKHEFDLLVKLPKKEHLIQNSEGILLEILDLLFTFCYEFRIMDGDLNVESAATINKISSTLYCFFCEENAKEVVKLSMLKCLTYALIRNFEICVKVQNFYFF